MSLVMPRNFVAKENIVRHTKMLLLMCTLGICLLSHIYISFTQTIMFSTHLLPCTIPKCTTYSIVLDSFYIYEANCWEFMVSIYICQSSFPIFTESFSIQAAICLKLLKEDFKHTIVQVMLLLLNCYCYLITAGHTTTVLAIPAFISRSLHTTATAGGKARCHQLCAN